MSELKEKKILLLANTSWYLYNFRNALIDKLISQNYKVIIIAPFDEYTSELKAKELELICWNLNRRSINPIKEFFSILELIKVYKKYSPSLVHHFTIKGCLYGSIAARLVTKSKIINHITGLGPSFFGTSKRVRIINRLLRPLYKYTFKSKNSKVIFHNQDDKNIFNKLKLAKTEDSIVINGSGVDTTYFSSKGIKTDYSHPPQILFPARVIREKGFIELLIACKELWNEGHEFTLNIAGSLDHGNRSSLTNNEIDLITNSNKLVFHGRVKDIRNLYLDTDIVVLPSWREGMSRSLIEASSMELPIITTDVPGCKEIVEHENTGLIVPVRDSLRLKGAIKYLLVNMETAISFGKNARQKIIKDYEIETINKMILCIYDSLIN